MGAYPPTELRKRWERAQLTGDQAIGHLTQNVEQLDSQLGQATTSLVDLRRDVESLLPLGQQFERFKEALLKLRRDVDSLIAHTEMPPSKR
jgi:hypothetical protein